MTRGTIRGGGTLHPTVVRDRQFTVVGFGRRGLDPEEVRRFLCRVALELATLHDEMTRLADENTRIKRALREWQGMHRRQP
ncbi:DivIVA domain-containing protein [Micromonospora sp. NPDC050980]|uniref:DivIVA domain-containing protein n=1 Tax=Micromonospora sp. NPDC050980 TaxID=3155161 RepID=UPI0033CD90A5